MRRDQREGLRAKSSGDLKTELILKLSDLPIAIVPLFAGHLAHPAADAFGNVDQCRSGGNRIGNRRHAFLPLGPDAVSTASCALTTFTRHAFVSWVPAPGSTASIVRWLTLGPVEIPLNPQLYGIHTIVTSWPSIFSVCILGVATAFTVTSPRADETLTQSPVLTPILRASDSGISMTGSGISSFSQGILRVVDPPHQ